MCWKVRNWLSGSRSRHSTGLENADVIVSLDADFLYAGFPGFTRYIRDFAKRRNPDAQHEPVLCDREHANFDRGEGRSSAAGAGRARSSHSRGRCWHSSSAGFGLALNSLTPKLQEFSPPWK